MKEVVRTLLKTAGQAVAIFALAVIVAAYLHPHASPAVTKDPLQYYWVVSGINFIQDKKGLSTEAIVVSLENARTSPLTQGYSGREDYPLPTPDYYQGIVIAPRGSQVYRAYTVGRGLGSVISFVPSTDTRDLGVRLKIGGEAYSALKTHH